jgi:hypothetical protein
VPAQRAAHSRANPSGRGLQGRWHCRSACKYRAIFASPCSTPSSPTSCPSRPRGNCPEVPCLGP